MSDYKFVSVWSIVASVPETWKLIMDADTWPEWWHGVLSSVELKAGDADGVGSIRRTVWKGKLPYRLEFDSEVMRVDNERLIEVRAFGNLEGSGLWRLEAEGESVTRVQYDWLVRTNKPWMNVLAPVARPIFRWNHDVVMRWGEEGLNRKLAKS